MIKIKVPATSANFSIGFDVCGIAFNIYNEFLFEKSDKNKLAGFQKEFLNDNNLVLQSYKRFFKEYHLEYIPISITLSKSNVPDSRGLGSSATCIVAGVLAANLISKSNLSNEALLTLMSKIEGHPDNVAPAFLGGFVASYKNKDEYKSIRYHVSHNLYFNVYIPNQHLSTEEARNVLPLNYSREDVISNLSRIIHLPNALVNGDYKLLKDLLKDKIHEPYRLKLIEHSNDLIKQLSEIGATCIISGSGSTMLGISDKEFSINNPYFKEVLVEVDLKGATIDD